jgi:hypothetical protein
MHVQKILFEPQLHHTARRRECCRRSSHITRAPPRLSHAHCGPNPNEHAVTAILVTRALLSAMTWCRPRGQAKTAIQVAAVLTFALIAAQHTDNDTIATCILADRLTSRTARRLLLTRTSVVLAGAVAIGSIASVLITGLRCAFAMPLGFNRGGTRTAQKFGAQTFATVTPSTTEANAWCAL